MFGACSLEDKKEREAGANIGVVALAASGNGCIFFVSSSPCVCRLDANGEKETKAIQRTNTFSRLHSSGQKQEFFIQDSM